MERTKLEEAPVPIKEEKEVKFFSTGSTLLDLALGGGWALPRVFNIVGDKSTGKTLLAIEGFANFKIFFPTGFMRYAEAEAAFDEVFASQLGFPEEVGRPDDLLHTVEEFTADFYKFIQKCKEAVVPGLYILDSLDALSDEAEVKKFEKTLAAKKKIEEGEEAEKVAGSYGAAKAKKMSELFRMLTQDAEDADCSLGIISQIRDNIGVRFGETKTRSGGRALDFYASQVLWLAEVGKISHTAMGESRVTGVNIHSKVKKCKVGFPFREADYDIIFGYGIDDEMSMIDWLSQIKALVPEAAKTLRKSIETARDKKDYQKLLEIKKNLQLDCRNCWKEIEEKLAPPIRKYDVCG